MDSAAQHIFCIMFFVLLNFLWIDNKCIWNVKFLIGMKIGRGYRHSYYISRIQTCLFESKESKMGKNLHIAFFWWPNNVYTIRIHVLGISNFDPKFMISNTGYFWSFWSLFLLTMCEWISILKYLQLKKKTYETFSFHSFQSFSYSLEIFELNSYDK